jgi:methyl-accepting chemotaxis protein
MRLTIRNKLLLGFMAVSLLFIIAIACNMWIQSKVDDLSDGILNSKNEQSILEKLIFLARNTNADAGSYLMSSTEAGKKKYLALHEKGNDDVSNQLRLIVNSHYHDDEELAAIGTFDLEWTKYLIHMESAFKAFQSNSVQKAHALYSEIAFEPVINSVVAYTDKLTAKIVVQEKEIDSFRAFVMKFNLSVIVITVIIAACLSLFISNRIEKPVLEVSKQLKEIAEGEGDLTKQIAVSTKDEIGDLAQFFNHMLANLRKMIQHIGFSAEQVASSSEQLTASSEQTSKATEHIAQIMQNMAFGTEKQVACLQESVATINEISYGIHHIATNIQEVAGASIRSSDMAQSGNEAIRTAIDQMGLIKRSILDLEGVIRVLGERSQEIDDIAKLITSIATETNLLSLNASIEAARAGEHGMGFAVVANEVKKLATESDRSAKQINDLIGTIQDETSKAILSMEASIREVNEGTAAIDQAGKSFEIIQKSVNDVSSQVQQLSEAVEQIDASSQDVVKSIHVVTKLSEENASGTQSISAASEQQLASMEELSSSASHLANMAEQLQALVKRFKV